MWIDPTSGGYVVFLSSRLYPDGAGDVTPLRARVATIAAAAIVDPAALTARTAMPAVTPAMPVAAVPPPSPAAPVLAGIDVLSRDGFAMLKGKRIGLVTNHTGRDRAGRSTIDVLQTAPGVTLVSLFSPEHGIRGTKDEENLASETDAKTGLTVHSLYGETRRPTDDMLKGIDTIVIDLADVGARFYTYHATMGYVMEEAAKRNIAVVVLDRPNPINGWQIEGPLPDKAITGMIAYHPLPTRHGLTMGELARLFNGERAIGANLTVVAADRWVRDAWFDQTGLAWVNPSPNMRNLNQATLYPGIGGIEFSNISVGRGTDQPFEQLGAPWIDGPALAERLNARRIPGIRFYPTHLHAVIQQVRGRSVQWHLHGDHGSHRAAAGADVAGDRGGADAAARRSLSAREHRKAVRLARQPGARDERRRPRGGGFVVGRGRSPLAPDPREISSVSIGRRFAAVGGRPRFAR